MTIDTTKLRELAQKAYQGAWEVDTRSGDNIWAPDCNIMVQCLGDKSNVSAMTSFLGAATPSTVLALLDELEKRTLRADILEEMVTRAQHHVIFSRELDKGMLKRLLTAGSDKWVYSLRNELSDAVMEIDRLTDENVRLRTIEAAARNLVKVKGRHHAEIAYQKLVEALG